MSDPASGARQSLAPLLAAVLLAVVLGVAELPFATFMADDLFQLALLEGRIPGGSDLAPWQLTTIADGVPAHVRALQNIGAMPWFFDPHFTMAFFRPLTSLLLATDHALWGLWPIGYRLHGIAWFVLLVVGLGLLLRRALPGPIGGLALIVFAISGIHASLFWNATRHVVVAGALGVFALAAHLRWRQAGWRPGRLLSVVGLALGLAAGEAALAVVAYLLAYEACGAAGDARARWRAAAPALALVAVYLALHHFLGFGAGRDGGYIDPLREPGAFLLQLPGRWLFLAGAMVLGGGADLWLLLPHRHAALVALGVASLAAFAYALRATWPSATTGERRGARWLIVGAAVSTIPFVGAPLGSRCLVLPMLGGSVAVAFVLQRWWATRRARRQPALATICALLAVIHLALAPATRLAAPYMARQMLDERVATVAREIDLDPQRLPTQRVVVLRAPDFIIGLHPYFFRALYRLPMPRSWRTLSWASAPRRFTRVADDTLELQLSDGEIAAPRLAVGDVIELDGLRVTVLARGDEGPTRVRFQFDRSLDDADLVLLAWRDDRLRRVTPPLVGDSATL
ncbi:MAG TPA: hypothetical protein VL049_12720 [Candidatus Dormibacteraeota bacterium]|nr:hypothetical protein [Candidatus Dormibacteraeota bacterium]